MPPSIPVATYRLQLTKDFGFDQAAAQVPYLKGLGISHLYSSPFLAARAGSTHGYDIVDHARLNPELGGEDAFYRMSDALKAHDMGLILDFVPNHMGVGRADNAWWLDVLEWGQKSPHAPSFDIDWTALPHRRQPGVLLPILGQPYGDALQAGEIELKYDAPTGTFATWYFENKLPINPHRYSEILRTVIAASGHAATPAGQALSAIAARYPQPTAPSYDVAPAFKAEIAAVDGGADVIGRGLRAYQGEQGVGMLHRLLERQHYRLAFWRIAFSGINYRRFFDINELAGLRIEHPATFRNAHVLVARLMAEDRLQGIRLDHIDGLRDPMQYCRRLGQLTKQVRGAGAAPIYVVIEKILGEGEPLPQFSGVSGTTGYEWLNVISRLLVDSTGIDKLDAVWRDFTGERASFAEMLDAAKLRVLQSMLASEFTVLTGLLSRIAAGHFNTRDYTRERLRAALQLYVLEFPVYRTYIAASGPSDHDRRTIEGAISRARRRWRGPDPDIFNFLRDAITTDLVKTPGYSAPRVRHFALKLQQFTGPMMAKSLEDTTFYRHHRLIALNEVGGDLVGPDVGIEGFHALMQERVKQAPHSLTATATHDTKRGEDARTRILVLSEIPDEWREAVETWRGLNAGITAESGLRPTASHEYMFYQALVGAWPLEGPDVSFSERMQAYALKAMREGKQETSWTNPDEPYEQAALHFLRAILSPDLSQAFIDSMQGFVERIARGGALSSLSQLVLKATMPGVPDFYQGTELPDFSLVDPDNRRAVDFADRHSRLAMKPDWNELSRAPESSAAKFELTRQLLALRNALPDLFRDGDYHPLTVQGRDASRVVAFARRDGKNTVIVVVARHFSSSTSTWSGHIEIPADANLYQWLRRERPLDLSNGRIDVAAAMSPWPVAIWATVPPAP